MKNGIHITPEGLKVLIDLGHAPEKFQSACREGLYETGKLLQKTVSQGILKTKKSGKFYKYRGRRMQASAPGEYTANRTGELRRGYNFQVDGFKRMRFGNEVEYSAFIELGTRRMKARPNIGKASRSTIEEVANILRQKLDMGLKNG